MTTGFKPMGWKISNAIHLHANDKPTRGKGVDKMNATQEKSSWIYEPLLCILLFHFSKCSSRAMILYSLLLPCKSSHEQLPDAPTVINLDSLSLSTCLLDQEIHAHSSVCLDKTWYYIYTNKQRIKLFPRFLGYEEWWIIPEDLMSWLHTCLRRSQYIINSNGSILF